MLPPALSLSLSHSVCRSIWVFEVGSTNFASICLIDSYRNYWPSFAWPKTSFAFVRFLLALALLLPLLFISFFFSSRFLSSSTSCCPFNLIAFHCITFSATSAAAAPAAATFQLGFALLCSHSRPFDLKFYTLSDLAKDFLLSTFWGSVLCWELKFACCMAADLMGIEFGFLITLYFE